ncbi:hypothetical protein [Leisingera sp. F5]|uniref:hypothetical protein n=1 Tax=Leisingera sp. F5 TaxID=1813816 RepID=UPI000A7DC1AD|nr:hypothetical protein [Leisingera sp. F5]
MLTCEKTGSLAGPRVFFPNTEPHDYALTDSDADRLEQVLASDALSLEAAAILHGKYDGARRISGPVPDDLVVPGRRIEFMISGGGAQRGTLAIGAVPAQRPILVSSALGATLLGMRILQKAPFCLATTATLPR